VASIKASSDFQRISRLGKKSSYPAFIMQALQHEQGSGPFRLGLTVSRKVGNAVIRNRAKRRLREIVRLTLPVNFSGWDIVLIGKTAAAEMDFARMRQDFAEGLKKLGVV
jgi:ribonuclease P protein component